MYSICRLLLILILVNILSGCIAVLIGGGAAGSYYYLPNDKSSSGHYTGDAMITSKIKSKFLADSNIKSFYITVNTTDGVVTLSGKVPTAAMKQRAIDVAARAKGVHQVIADNLRVGS